ncbi:cold-shock protein [Streptomyces agglomeratus]|nr:cold shock domain-containing protein [Streptomyces agglomeratus]
MAERQSGTVKWFNDEKGFGFITPFVAVQGQRGMQADEVIAEG